MTTLFFQLLNEGMRLGIAEAVFKEFLHQKKTKLLELAQNRKEKNNKVSQLLTARAESACTEGKRVFKDCSHETH